MATTTSQAFELFRSRLEITDLQAETVSTRQQSVRQAVESNLAIYDSFLTGSYSRNTMIAPLANADVDIFVVLNPQYYQANGQVALLDKVKTVLKQTYPKTPEISRNGQAVTILFSDFQVDVVPAFLRKGGGYLIPNTQGGTWIATDPKKHVEISAATNKANGQNLVPLVKMIKSWNRAIIDLSARFIWSTSLAYIQPNHHHPVFRGRRPLLRQGRTLITDYSTPRYGGDVGNYIKRAEDIRDAKSHFEGIIQQCERLLETYAQTRSFH